MKIQSLLLYSATTVILLSCNPAKKEDGNSSTANATNENPNNVIWAEQVLSATDLVKTENWNEEDWNAITKNVDQEKIYENIIQSVLDGKQKGYNFVSDSVMPMEEIKAMINKVDSIYTKDPKTGKQKLDVITKTIGAKDISHVATTEKWMYDVEKMKMQKQVNTIALFSSAFNEEGNLIGYRPLFYVKMN